MTHYDQFVDISSDEEETRDGRDKSCAAPSRSLQKKPATQQKTKANQLASTKLKRDISVTITTYNNGLLTKANKG
jgi:hypothetical protein